MKQRKSDATQTIGACIVSHAGASLIICPHRFIAHDQIFHDCIPLLAADVSQPHFYIVPEIKIPGGTVDYFLVTTDGSVTLDYAGIEIQSLDTTGSGGIWQAREDIRQGQLDATYSYGINWRMSAKTILMQMHHKALSFERLGKKLVLVVQSEFFRYMEREFSAAHLQPASVNDSVHFHIYDVTPSDTQFHLELRDRKSTTASGIERMLGLGRAADITSPEIIQRITAKWAAGRPLDSAKPLDVGMIAEENEVDEE